MKRTTEIAKYLALALIAGTTVAWAKTTLNLDLSFFSKDAYATSLTTFSTGAMVSIFLTIFHSDNEKVSIFRQKYHAKTLYLLVIINNALIVLLSGFTDSAVKIAGIGLSGLSIAVSTALGILLTWFVIRIISMFFSVTTS